MHGILTELGAYSEFQLQLGYQLFDAAMIVFNTTSTATETMKSDPDVLAIIIEAAKDIIDDDSITLYNSSIMSVQCSFFRREVTADHKTNRTGDLHSWQFGNEQLALAYEAAFIATEINGKRDDVLTTWNMSVVNTADCIARQGGGLQVPEKVGSLENVINKRMFVVGDVRNCSNFLLDTSVDPPTGPLHVLNWIIIQWITKEYGLDRPIQLVYELFNTTDEVFAALESGTIDATSNAYYVGGMYKNKARGAEFRPTCFSFAYEMFVIVRESDHLTTVDALWERLKENPEYDVGAVTSSNCGIMRTMLAKYGLHNTVLPIYDNKAAVEILSGVQYPKLLAVLPEWMPELPAGLRELRLQQVLPLNTFFRRDIVDSCTDDQLDPYFGEECLNKTVGCTTSCKCKEGYRPIPTGTCEKIVSRQVSPRLVALLSLCIIFFVVFFVLVVVLVVVLLVLRRRKATPTIKEVYLTSELEEIDGEPFDEACSTAVDADDFNLEASLSKLTFSLGSHQADVDAQLTEEFTLRNKCKKQRSFKFFVPTSHKYRLTFLPSSGVLQKHEEVTITAILIVTCTTKLNTSITLAVKPGSDHEHFFTGDEKHQQSTSSSLTLAQHIHLLLCLESKLSMKLDPDEFEIITPQIGEGSFGHVFRATWRGQECAVKLLKYQELFVQDMHDAFLREVSLMETLRAPQIVNFIGAVHVPKRLALITEFLPLGSLISAMKKSKFCVELKLKCLLDCAKGMNFLHESGVLHRDLKGDNLLVCSLDYTLAVNCKLSDFGTTRDVQPSDKANFTQAIGTPTHMAPEVLEHSAYSTSSDVYSFAVMAYNLLTEKEPFAEFESMWAVTKFVVEKQRLEIPANAPPPIAHIISACWAHIPQDRPSFAEVSAFLDGAIMMIASKQPEQPL
eukprot:TRINITY_DN2294_c0_g2_i1.p1 TRINITY_DN2294_c0_g2~~TRINITY_DN2294_c0_g2_i1.p1  ORF type:complete len:903 (+),score=177.71 TRINITY_DN2294_c0_g2_i1:715-3423(+)